MRSSGGLSGVAKQGTRIMGRKETITGIYKNREVYIMCVCVCVCGGGGGGECTGG